MFNYFNKLWLFNVFTALLLFVRRHAIILRCGKGLAADALLGVSSLDLRR